MNLSEISTKTLWKILEDISKLEVMKDHPNNDYFIGWERISKSVLNEIDKRMENDYET